MRDDHELVIVQVIVLVRSQHLNNMMQPSNPPELRYVSGAACVRTPVSQPDDRPLLTTARLGCRFIG